MTKSFLVFILCFCTPLLCQSKHCGPSLCTGKEVCCGDTCCETLQCLQNNDLDLCCTPKTTPCGNTCCPSDAQCYHHVPTATLQCCSNGTFNCAGKCCNAKCIPNQDRTSYECCQHGEVLYLGSCRVPTNLMIVLPLCSGLVLAGCLCVLVGTWKRHQFAESMARPASGADEEELSSLHSTASSTRNRSRSRAGSVGHLKLDTLRPTIASSSMLNEVFDLDDESAKFASTKGLRLAVMRVANYRHRWLALYHFVAVNAVIVLVAAGMVPNDIYFFSGAVVVLRGIVLLICAFQAGLHTLIFSLLATLVTWILGLHIVFSTDFRVHGWVVSTALGILGSTSIIVPRCHIEIDRSFESSALRVTLWFVGVSKLIPPQHFSVPLERLMEVAPSFVPAYVLSRIPSLSSPRPTAVPRFCVNTEVRRNMHDPKVKFNFSPVCILEGPTSVGATVKITGIRKIEDELKYTVEGTTYVCPVKLMELHFDNAEAVGMFKVGDVVKRNNVDNKVILDLGGSVGKIKPNHTFTVSSFFTDREGGKYRLQGSQNYIRQEKFEKWFELSEAEHDAARFSSPPPAPFEVRETSSHEGGREMSTTNRFSSEMGQAAAAAGIVETPKGGDYAEMTPT